jgi:hypothetical protein
LQAKDANGNNLTSGGLTVVFSASGGTSTGTISATTDNLNGTYTATFTGVTAGTATTISATINASPVTDTDQVTVTPGAAADLTIETQPSSTVANGVVFPQQPSLQLRDQNGNAVAQSGVAVNASIASGSGTLGGTTTAFTTDGVATFANLSITGTVGDYTIAFTATDIDGDTSATITLTVGAATQLTIETQPSGTATNGVAFAQQPVIRLRDSGNNFVSQSGVSVTAAIASGPGTLGGTTTVATDVNGTASFTNLVITGTAGSYTLSFTAPGLTGATSSTITLQAGAATQIQITTQPSTNATNGIPFATQPVLRVRDQSGNDVAQAGTVISAAVLTGPGGTLSWTAPVTTDGTGAAAFVDLAITGTVGNYTLVFTATGLDGDTSTTITLQAGAATALTLTTAPPDTVTNDVAFATQPVLQLVDGSGNPVAQSDVAVSAVITLGGGTLGGTTTVNTVSGVATFTNLKITGTAGDRTISFQSGLLEGVDAIVTVVAGAATQLTITTQPSSSAESGVPFTQQPVIQLRDVSGNAVADSGVAVTATIATGIGALGGTTTIATGASGAATFLDLSITGSGDYTLQFSATGLSSVTSNNINVTVVGGSSTGGGGEGLEGGMLESGILMRAEPRPLLAPALTWRN